MGAILSWNRSQALSDFGKELRRNENKKGILLPTERKQISKLERVCHS